MQEAKYDTHATQHNTEHKEQHAEQNIYKVYQTEKTLKTHPYTFVPFKPS